MQQELSGILGRRVDLDRRSGASKPLPARGHSQLQAGGVACLRDRDAGYLAGTCSTLRRPLGLLCQDPAADYLRGDRKLRQERDLASWRQRRIPELVRLLKPLLPPLSGREVLIRYKMAARPLIAAFNCPGRSCPNDPRKAPAEMACRVAGDWEAEPGPKHRHLESKIGGHHRVFMRTTVTPDRDVECLLRETMHREADAFPKTAEARGMITPDVSLSNAPFEHMRAGVEVMTSIPNRYASTAPHPRPVRRRCGRASGGVGLTGSRCHASGSRWTV